MVLPPPRSDLALVLERVCHYGEAECCGRSVGSGFVGVGLNFVEVRVWRER